jgi:hypothetical protein
MSRTRKVLTFSNVVACLALFMALGGTVYAAGKISGTQIQPGSIPGNRLKASSVATNQLKASAVTGGKIKAKTITGGKIKPGSLTGTQVNGTTLTGVSAASIGSVQYATVVTGISSTSKSGTTATATCPLGTFVIGGGATVNNEEKAFVNDSGPNSTRNGWTATGFAFGTTDATITITAICTPVKAITG